MFVGGGRHGNGRTDLGELPYRVAADEKKLPQDWIRPILNLFQFALDCSQVEFVFIANFFYSVTSYFFWKLKSDPCESLHIHPEFLSSITESTLW